MQRGRKPDSPALRIVKGKKVRPGEAEASEALLPLGPPPRDWNAARRGIWHEIVNALPWGVAGKPDRLLVELATTLVCLMRADPASMTPALASQIRTSLGELGMTPGGRARLGTPAPRPPSDNDHFFDD